MEQYSRRGELAKELGVSVSTIRKFERKGLLKPVRDWAGHWRFSQEEKEKLLRLVRGDHEQAVSL